MSRHGLSALSANSWMWQNLKQCITHKVTRRASARSLLTAVLGSVYALQNNPCIVLIARYNNSINHAEGAAK